MNRTTMKSAGFTLIELLIVVAIIGILAAIAIPSYTRYRQTANDTRALNQVRDMAKAEELYFIDKGAYTTVLNDLIQCGFSVDPNVTRTRSLVDKNGVASSAAYRLTATHKNGTGRVYVWQSDNGGLQ